MANLDFGAKNDRPKISSIFFSKLQSVWPEPRKTDVTQQTRRVFLPVGSSLDVAFRGGPYPKFSPLFDFFIKGVKENL